MISDEVLYTAAGEYEQALLSALPETAECNHRFSPKFEKKMRHLLYKVKYQSAYTIFKRIACAVIVIILCGGMLLMLNTEVRAAVIGWIKDTYKSYTSYFFAGKASEEPIPQAYDFKEVPEGYVLLKRFETNSGASVYYAHENGNMIAFSYEFSEDSGASYFKAEDHIFVQEYIDGITMDIYLSQNPKYTNAIIWETEEKILFSIIAKCDKDGLIELAKNIVPIE